MKEVEKAVTYLKELSIKEPCHIRVEEITLNRIILSYEENNSFAWQERIYKEFKFKNGKVISMNIYK